MLSKYDFLKQIEKRTNQIFKRELENSYKYLVGSIIKLHRQLNASMGEFETDDEIYERYIKNDEMIESINPYKKEGKNLYVDTLSYNKVYKERCAVSENFNDETEWFRDAFRSDLREIKREFELKCAYIKDEEIKIARNKIINNLHNY